MRIKSRFAIWIGILAVLCALTVVGLAACDSKTEEVGNATTVATTEGTTEPDVTTAAVTTDGVTSTDGVASEAVPETSEGATEGETTDEPAGETSEPTGAVW